MYRLVVHDDAYQDLDEIQAKDEATAGILEIFLETIASDQRQLDNLTVHEYGAHRSKPYHVSRWQAYWRDRVPPIDLWRVKLWSLEHHGTMYRIVYHYKRAPASQYTVLAVLPREFDYDPAHPRTKRLLAVCDGLE